MQPINEATDRTLPTRPDTSASSIEGGRAYLADMARAGISSVRRLASGPWRMCTAC